MSQGNNYIIVAYHPDANAILIQPLKNRTAPVITKAWTTINDCFKRAGVKPLNWIMDNECSNNLKNALTKEEVTWQFVPPHQHRANLAERAIQTFKHHFKACLASLDPDFPAREWDRLLVQSELTLNLLRAARANPKLSAWAYLFGQFDYNKTPLVPP